MNDNNKPQVEVQLIKDTMQAIENWKELLAGAMLISKGITTDHIGMIRIKIAVAESRLLELVPDNLLNELGFDNAN